MSADFEAIVAGHICLDIIPTLPEVGPGDLFRPGRLIEVGPAAISTGGPVSNTGLALHRLGVSTRLVCKVGADPFGDILRGLVSQHGEHLAEGIVVDAHTTTAYSVILSPPGRDRMFLHNPAANHQFGLEDVDLKLAGRARLFHFGYPPVMRRMYANGGRELAEIFRQVKALGTTTSLDLCAIDPDSEAGRADWRAILTATLVHTDIFLPSLEELLFMLHRAEYDRLRPGENAAEQICPARLDDLADELVGMGVRIAGIKLGDHGLYLRTADAPAVGGIGAAAPPDLHVWANRRLWAPCFRVKVAGATGAGDSTIAGFLAALLRGFSPEQAITAATAVGACNVEAVDALSGLRSWDETLARVQADWERLIYPLDDPAWIWRADPGVWERQQ
jgi:sugar/nucleoside kinase (ribokinase family)